jgi:hypothetical protein
VLIHASRNKSGWFMQHDRKRGSDVNELMIDFDMVAPFRLKAEIGANLAVNCDAPCRD